MPAFRLAQLAPSRRAWLAIGIAFLAGLLLFLLIWARQRNDYDFYRVDGTTRSAEGRQFDPLPVPDTDATGDNAGAPAAAGNDEEDDRPRVADEALAPPAPPREQLPPPPPQALPDTATAGPADVAPVPVSSPPPQYPREALRRGESGEALLRIHVGADGVPGDIDLVRSSGSRSLDRAATDAVRKWRFQPARRGGQPIPGTVQVPIAFSSPR
ncbi:energy transducer TonB [Luteimonas aquatica]|uniref:energy transducer TonB n=1 Tax=Luteimonas aquatica TaxID=450364 RepID=UPI001F57C283|nr:energy transducer TonB [Luteimonas aquatica]